MKVIFSRLTGGYYLNAMRVIRGQCLTTWKKGENKPRTQTVLSERKLRYFPPVYVQ